MSYDLDHPEIREGVARLCEDFPGEYWREKDRNQAYPTEFVAALTAGLIAPKRFPSEGSKRLTEDE